MRPTIGLGIVAMGSLLALSVFVAAAEGETTRVSVSSNGTESDAASFFPSVSANGRYVAFQSSASNLVANDTNGVTDVFLKDRQTGIIERVSVSSSNAEGNNGSFSASVSANGRYVAFYSLASNLVADDTNELRDVFVYDRQTTTTERVSVSSTDTQGTGGSLVPSVSANGRYVAFESSAPNLVANDLNGAEDVFVRDRQTDTTERVSVASDGTEGSMNSSGRPSISAGGRYIAFASFAPNLVANDSNSQPDVFVHDRETNNTERVSMDSNGAQGNSESVAPSMSADGRYVGFRSFASNLVVNDTNSTYDVFIHDRQTGITERVSVSSNGTESSSLSSETSCPATGATSPSFPLPRTWWLTTPIARMTCSFTTAKPPPRSEFRCRPTGPKATMPRTARRCQPTDVTSPSNRWRRIWWLTTPTMRGTCSSIST